MIERICLIGGSAGSSHVISEIVSALPKAFPYPVIILVHMRGDTAELMVDNLSRVSALPVTEARDKTHPQTGTIYVAPGDYHLLIEHDGTLSLSQDEPVHFCRPAIDLLFTTAAEVWGKRCIALLLSGSNNDGAIGLKRIKEQQGLTLVQAPDSAECPAMPEYAISIGASERILPPSRLIDALLASLE